jgi:hypothetical protein
MFDVLGSYTKVFWIITIMSFVGLGLIMLLKPIKTRANQTGV